MSDDERIEQLELENKVLKENNKGLKAKIDELQKELDKKDKILDKTKSKLEEHIKFCEQEAKGHLDNKVCHISLKFDKSLLEIIKKVEEENE